MRTYFFARALPAFGLALLVFSCRGSRDRPEALTITIPPVPPPGDADAVPAVPDAASERPDAAEIPDQAQSPPPADSGGDAAAIGPLPSLAPLVARIRPSVVNITAEVVSRGVGIDPFGRRVALPPRVADSLGSGFIVDSNGTILSNAHVVRGADRITVGLDDGREVPARIVGVENEIDLAVLDIDVEGLTALELGDSDAVHVGDYAVAVGNPMGLSNTVTAGIVSAVGREITREVPGYADFIQTDASINQGNSGGPLVDLQGRVIGINTAINPEGQGIGFAVPINMVRQVLPQILDHGSVTRAWLGLWYRPLDRKNARRLGIELPQGAGRQRVWIVDVLPGSPAEAAGIRPNDVVLRYGGQEIDRPALFGWIASTSAIGRPVAIELWREGQTLSVEATPAEPPERGDSPVEPGLRRNPFGGDGSEDERYIP